MIDKNFSEDFCQALVDLKYSHCFYVAGGNIMHLLNAARSSFKCIPVIHEVAAVVAAEAAHVRASDDRRAQRLRRGHRRDQRDDEDDQTR